MLFRAGRQRQRSMTQGKSRAAAKDNSGSVRTYLTTLTGDNSGYAKNSLRTSMETDKELPDKVARVQRRIS